MSSGSSESGAVLLDYAPVTPRASILKSLGWACFLACSWTWCIGMFLPVLLVRDYGVWGWVVFAVPNMIGAAAMGWVIRDGQSSRRIVDAHGVACCAFSIATLTFHIFWVIWLSRLFSGLWMAVLVSGVILYLVGAQSRGDLMTGFVVLILSLFCFASELSDQRHELASAPWIRNDEGHYIVVMLALTIVCCFGFALCPYLDLTFHRARQATSGDARVAFGLGFGLFFLLMILFTLAYSVDIRIARFLPRVSHEPTRALSPLHVVALHMAMQTGFTIAIHVRSLRSCALAIPSRALSISIPIVSLIALILGTLAYFDSPAIRPRTGEIVYRCFMGFYGLIFPAYVWLCMIPTRGRERPTKRMLIIFAAAVLAAMPFYAVAFLAEDAMVYAFPGLAIVLLARLLIRRGDACIAV